MNFIHCIYYYFNDYKISCTKFETINCNCQIRLAILYIIYDGETNLLPVTGYNKLDFV